MQFDILPPTLDGFMALGSKGGAGPGLAWDSAFPALADADGDNLLGRAFKGLDPDDATPDADGDGLTDTYELERRSNGVAYSPTASDPDNDGLSDFAEMQAGSDPASADGDGDGLADKAEVDGWNVTINGTTSFTVRVTGDPRQADSDADGLSDTAERTLALHSDPAQRVDRENRPYHPRVHNSPPILVYPEVDDPDRFVQPGQRLLYTTTMVREIPLDRNGQLSVTMSPAIQAPATYQFDFASSTVVQQTALTVLASASTQNAAINSRVQGQLPNNGGAVTGNGGLTVTIDGDKPTASLTSLSDGQRVDGDVAGTTLIIGGTASDPTSAVARVEVSANNHPWQLANGTDTWTYALPVSWGRYEIRVRATDTVGNVQTSTVPITIWADTEGPFAYYNGSGWFAPTRNHAGQYFVRLTGTVSDPPIEGFESVPGSGVQALNVSLVPTQFSHGEPLPAQRATLGENFWTLDYIFPGGVTDNAPAGWYEIVVESVDKVGNTGSQGSGGVLRVDARAPIATLDQTDVSKGTLSGTITTTATLGGSLSEIGPADLDVGYSHLPGRPDQVLNSGVQVTFAPLRQVAPLSDTLFLMRFDEPNGPGHFNDSSGQLNVASCRLNVAPSSCPTAVEGGRFDGAFDFTGAKALTTSTRQPSLQFGNTRSFSVQAWVKPNSDARSGLIVNGDFRLGIKDSGVAVLYFGGLPREEAIGGPDLRDGNWHHLVGVIDRASSQASLYVDGVLRASGALRRERTFDGGTIGLGNPCRDGDGCAYPNRQYDGLMDEVAVIGHALIPAEVQALTTTERTWHFARPSSRNNSLQQGNWTLPVPAGLEDEYQVDVRVRDRFHNRAVSNNVWRGTIDVVAPRVTFRGRATGETYLDQATNSLRYAVVYSCAAEDGYLAARSFACAGDADSSPTPTYDTDPIRQQLFPGASRLNKLANTYTVWQTTPEPTGTATACDLFNHCTTTNAQPETPAARIDTPAARAKTAAGATAGLPEAVIVAPTDGRHVAAAGNVPVVVAAQAAQALKEVVVTLDDQVVATLPFAQADATTETLHSFDVPVANIGAHTLSVRASDWAGNTQQSVVARPFTLDRRPPTATIADTTVTISDTYTLGSGVLRFHGTAEDDVGLSAVQVRVDDQPFVDAQFGSGTWWIAYPLGDPEGKTYSVTVRATDLAGQHSDVTQSMRVDLSTSTPPDTAISAGPANPTGDTTATFSFSGTSGTEATSAFGCQLDDGQFTPCTSPRQYTDLSKGNHTFRVRAIDASGFVDPSPASATWSITAGSLDATIVDQPDNPSTSATARFTFTGSANARGFECKLDDSSFTGMYQPTRVQWAPAGQPHLPGSGQRWCGQYRRSG